MGSVETTAHAPTAWLQTQGGPPPPHCASRRILWKDEWPLLSGSGFWWQKPVGLPFQVRAKFQKLLSIFLEGAKEVRSWSAAVLHGNLFPSLGDSPLPAPRPPKRPHPNPLISLRCPLRLGAGNAEMLQAGSLSSGRGLPPQAGNPLMKEWCWG